MARRTKTPLVPTGGNRHGIAGVRGVTVKAVEAPPETKAITTPPATKSRSTKSA